VCVVVDDAVLVLKLFEKWLVLSSVARGVTIVTATLHVPTMEWYEDVMEALSTSSNLVVIRLCDFCD
jgi:hypothetical protein